MSLINYSANYNGSELTSVNGLTILGTNPYRPAKRNVDISELIRTSRAKVNSANYNEKYIIVRVGITRPTRALVEQSFDDLMAIVQPIEKPLIVPQGATNRLYYCTYQDFVTDESKEGGSYIEGDLIFECSDRYGYDVNPTLLLNINTAFTSQTRSDALTFGGSALWQTPVISLTFSALAGSSSRIVRVGNSLTGQEAVITRVWSAGDNLVIDSFNNTVRVNGIDVDFTGAGAIKWAKGIGYWYYGDTFTSRTFTGQITCTNRYV